MKLIRWVLIAMVGCVFGVLPAQDIAAQPLHAEIDRLIAAAAKGPLAGPADDAEFLRRLSLDLAGVIPTADQARTFLSSSEPDKRTRLIDQLLAGPQYPVRMQEALGVMLLDRRAGKAIDDETWNAWLREALAANRPWDVLVRQMIAADGTEEATRPGIRFFVDGGRTDAHLATQDIARIFLGYNWQCNQCHDHPTVMDYKQAHYFGLYAFVSSSKSHVNKEKRTLLAQDVLKSKVEFVSVFLPDDKRATGPKLLESMELAIPEFKAGEEFITPPDKAAGVAGVPKFQPRQALAEQLTSSENRQFARNAVNRFWFLMTGRGLVHPLDMHHSDNPPSHPQLLETLTDEFIAHAYDVKWLLREIALSAAYQRSSLAPGGVAAGDVPAKSFRMAQSRAMSAEQLSRSLATALGQQELIDGPPNPDSKFTYKDYVNGRLPPPDNWKDVQILLAAVFGHPAGQAEVDFRPSVEQSLFLTNDPLIDLWLKPAPGNLTHRLNETQDPVKQVEETYLSLLTRYPTEEEQAAAVEFITQAEDREQANRDLCQVLLTTAEFRLNH